ncbi:neurotrypsin-like [Ptychodera flava]|uniref:neurotrypsin-like n=1 Tax=Ptychodera flava TaxID=63121 RepID=UPI00396A5EB4
MESKKWQARATLLLVAILLLVVNVLSVRGNRAKVRLVDGSSPYDGLVELYVNDTTGWLPVCGTRGVWHFVDADVICNQLGYNGAMRSGRENNILRNDPRRVVDQVACPANSITIDDCSFNIEEAGHCTDGARITCNFHGYIGCFNNNASDPVLADDEEETNQMTIEWCLDYCRERNWTYAGLSWRKFCHCGRQGTDYARQGVLQSQQCSTPCGGNNQQVCGGGKGRISIYNKVYTACPLPREIKHGHFNVTGDCTKNWTLSVTCNEGLQVSTSHSSVVCYEGHGWNDTLPTCTAEVPVKLTDGVLPNEGLVEVFDSEYGWLKVCLIGSRDKTWSWNEADVVCTQLGYDGAMRHTLGKQQASGIFGIASVNCEGDENSILDCGYSTSNSCSQLIKTRCNYIGYVGCFNHGVVDHRWNSSDSVSNSTMTIEWCLEYCRSRDMFYAGLKNKNQCYCGQRSPDEKYRRRNNNCNQACEGDKSQSCGGRSALSVYPSVCQ